VRLLKPSLLRLLCTTIVAVFQLHPAAAAAISEDVPVPGGTAALAQSLGIDPVPDRGRFVYEVTRLLYNAPEGRKSSADAFLLVAHQIAARGRGPVDTRAGETVPVPLTADLWSSAIFRRTVAPRDLVTAIIADRSAALLCLGLASLDDPTLAFFADHPQLLERIYEHASPAFAAFSGSLHIRGNRLVPPGGDAAVALWEGVVLEKITRTDRFIQQLLELNDGRLAYLYDVIGELDPPHRAFALGLWVPNVAARAERFKTLTVGIGAFREAHLRTLPLGRSSYDVLMTLTRVEVGPDGTPMAPAARGFWSRAFGGNDLPDDASRQLRGIDEEPIDAAWLIDVIGVSDVRARAERLDQIAFGQRLFAAATAAERPDVLVVEGGNMRVPGNMRWERIREPGTDFSLDLGPGTALACMSETMLLALCDRRESYTLGRGIDLPKVREIDRLAEQAGFTLADMRGFDLPITSEKIASVRNAAADRRAMAS